MENIRLFLAVAFAFLGLMLWQAWQEDYGQVAPFTEQSERVERVEQVVDAPTLPTPAPTSVPPIPSAPTRIVDLQTANDSAALIEVQTDLFSISLSTVGGNLERAALVDYPIDPKYPEVSVELLGHHPPQVYVYQGGLAGAGNLPTHHALYTSEKYAYDLADNDELVVPFTWYNSAGVAVEKRYRFKRDTYLVEVQYVITNGSSDALRIHQYEQLKRNEESSRQGMVYTFTGAALSTPEKRFEKFDLGDLSDQPLEVTTKEGWVGIIQHYFVSALIPPAEKSYQYYSKVLDNYIYLVGFLSPAVDVAPGQTHTFSSQIYIGPKRHDRLGKVAPGLELSVDYGVLWFIAKPLFSVLRYIYDLTGNWGWAIILLTVLLKLFFFPLSAAGYRSMANMRKVQPRMIALRDRHADDKARLNQAMMKLYKDEKINPLGGCLPIVIQIPVFIALYWVLLESVEMRQAPFILWFNDLSTKDPYFVLPLLMGISMWGQQKLNPAPLDPTQAKVMQILPFVFTIFFAFFPSGLVLYWLVNNILSIAQQWQITRSIENSEA